MVQNNRFGQTAFVLTSNRWLGDVIRSHTSSPLSDRVERLTYIRRACLGLTSLDIPFVVAAHSTVKKLSPKPANWQNITSVHFVTSTPVYLFVMFFQPSLR